LVFGPGHLVLGLFDPLLGVHYLGQVESDFANSEVLVLHFVEQSLLVLLLPLLRLLGLLLPLALGLLRLPQFLPKLEESLLFGLEGLSQQFVALDLAHWLAGLETLASLVVAAFLDRLGELEDAVDLFVVLLVDFGDDLEGPVALAEDLEQFLLLAVVLFLNSFDFHAVPRPFRTLDVELNGAL